MKLSEAANRVIALASKMYDYCSTELPKRHPNYPLVGPDDVTAPPPPEEEELEDFLASLSDELIYQLLLIMHLGREAFGIDDLAGYYEMVRREYNLEYATSELMGNAPVLADYLSDALTELRKHHIDVDDLPLKAIWGAVPIVPCEIIS